jgi:hypothetical protein
VSKLTHEKDVIYDCRFADKLPKCVTYSGNIASDATGTVQLLFTSALNSGKPACLTWVRAAKARLARIAARKAAARRAARAQAYEAALERAAKEPWHHGYTEDWTGIEYGNDLPNVYWKWLSGYSCADYALNGCWKIEVVTRNGCPNSLSVELQELRGGTQVGTLYGSSGSLSPQTPAIVEIDADSGDATAMQGQMGSITCN